MTKVQQKTNEQWKAFLDMANPDEKMTLLMEDPVFKPKKRVQKLKKQLDVAKKIKQKNAEKRHEASLAAQGHT